MPPSEVAQLSQQSQLSSSQTNSQADDERIAAEWQQQVNDEKRKQDPKQTPAKPEVELLVKAVEPKPAMRMTRSSQSRETSPMKDSGVSVESPLKKRRSDEATAARPARGAQKGRGSNARA